MKRHKTVVEMIDDICPEMSDEVRNAIESRRLISELMARRASLHMSIEDVAEASGVPTWQIEAMENTQDDYCHLRSLRGYAKAVGYELKIELCKSLTPPANKA